MKLRFLAVVCCASLVVCLPCGRPPLWSQQSPAPGPDGQGVIRTRTNLVLVPTLVETKKGEPVFALQASDFVVLDNGVAQKARLEEDTDDEPLSLAVVVQTGREAMAESGNMQGLGTMVDAITGDSLHRVAVISFDSQPHLLQEFSSSPSELADGIKQLQGGDGGAAILDAVKYATVRLADEPPEYRRAILLISETRDHGSHTKIEEAVRRVGETNTVVYSAAFSPSATELKNGVKGQGTSNGSANLLAPLLMAVAAFKKNTAYAVAHLTGGEYLRFNSQQGFDRGLGELANHVHNRYMLRFQPQSPSPGLHRIEVVLPNHADLRVIARENYWAISELGN